MRLAAALATVLAPAVLGAPGAALAKGDEARFRILSDERWGYIDASGKIAIAPQFERAAEFSEGLAAVKKGSTFGYVDPQGKLALVPEQTPVGALHRRFADGRAVVRVARREGAIDRDGKLVIPARFVSIGDFSEGHALACDDEACGWIDVDGRRVLGPAGMGGSPLRGGIATGWLSMGMGRKRAFLHRLGRGRLPEEYEDTGNFSEGLVAVRLEKRWGYVDGDGAPRIPLRFEWAGDFSEGLAPVRAERVRCGYIDPSGAFAIPARFRDCRPFSNGRARVDLATDEHDAPRVGFIDRTGTPVVVGDETDPPFDSALDFAGGLAAVGQGGAVLTVAAGVPTGALLGYVDPTGRYVWKPTR